MIKNNFFKQEYIPYLINKTYSLENNKFLKNIFTFNVFVKL